MIRFVTISLLIIVSSCSRSIERIPEPKDLVPRKKMVTVLKEMMKLEAHIQTNYGGVGSYYKVMQRSGDSLLSIYSLDRMSFESSLDYYGSRQDEMKKIYDDALNQLNEELGKLEAEEEAEQKEAALKAEKDELLEKL